MIKKTIVLFVAIIIFNNPVFAQEQDLINSILKLTKERSVYKNNVEWETIDKKVREAVNSDGNTMLEIISPAVGVLLDELNDSHSFIKINDKKVGRATQVDLFERVNEETINALKGANQQKIKTFKFDDTIGYLEIPPTNHRIK